MFHFILFHYFTELFIIYSLTVCSFYPLCYCICFMLVKFPAIVVKDAYK